ncbi:MAG: major capsid protein [Rhodoglobus sp.]
MAALNDTRPNYLDWVKRRDPDGGMAKIVEIMAKSMPILDDMVVVEANGPLHHRTTVRSGLPVGAWRKLNYGVPVEKGKTKQVNDVIGSLETYAEVDKMIADLNGNTAEWRMSEEKGFMEGLAQTMATTVIEGNTDTNPERFMGLAARYNSYSTAENGRMIVQSATAAATDVNSSIWGIVWDDSSVHGLFPKGMSGSAGLKVEDLGQETLLDGAGGYYEGYRTHYQWMAGLSVRDWRRACRIHVNNADIIPGGGSEILNLMADAYNNLYNPNGGRLVWYTTREVKTYLDIEAMQKTNMALGQQQQDNGGPCTTFWGAPVKFLETLLSYTEARIPA